MSKVISLAPYGLRSRSQRIAEFLRTFREGPILFDLAEDFEGFLRDYIKGEISEAELWDSYRILTGAQEAFVRASMRAVEPIIRALRGFRERAAQVHCYQSLESVVESYRVAERIVLLQLRSKVRGKVDVSEWKRALLAEAKCAERFWSETLDAIMEKIKGHRLSAMLYDGDLGELKRGLEREGVSLEALPLGRYWRTSLDVLRAMMRRRDVGDEEIELCVKRHMDYLNLVLRSEDLDEAHERWTEEMEALESRSVGGSKVDR
ncbi:MAG: hypothetical protein QXQ76_01180 [Candidatus Bathyarchaeia archaeon]